MYFSLFQSRYCLLLLLQLVLHQGLKLSLPWAEACGELMSYNQPIDSLFAITDSLIALSKKHVQTDICFILKVNHIRWLLARSTTSEESGKLFRWSNSHFLPPSLNIFLEHWDFYSTLPLLLLHGIKLGHFFAELAEDLIPCGFSTKISFQYFSSLLGNPLKYISTKGNFQILGLQYPILVKTFVGTFFFL